MGAFDGSLGLLLVVNIITSMLWALSCTQIWSYFHYSVQKDPLLLKIVVIIISLVDGLGLCLNLHWLYEYAVTHFGDLQFLQKGPRSATVEIARMEVIVLIVQCFYIWKIWILSHRNWIVPSPIVIATIVHLGLTIYVFSRNLHVDGPWNEYVIGIKGYLGGLFGIMAATDFLISACMFVLLRRVRSEYLRTRSLIQEILALTLGTNFITAVLALAVVITGLGWSDKLYWLAPFLALPRLYTISFYSTLNMRPRFAARLAGVQEAYMLSDHNRRQEARSGLSALVQVDTFVHQENTCAHDTKPTDSPVKHVV